jgi:4-amino-4-deoxy-L-arabinose transferase-like glycosyltransferase
MALRPSWLHGLFVSIAVFTYFYGLDSQHIPKNGDEYPYEHITRLTAESGRLLPLCSDLPEMRNTKPPLLFWQGIASTSWGRAWTLWNLRYPSVLYTLATALMVFFLASRLSRQVETGFLATLNFLAFFSTYRFGRPFLTNPPEVFWLFLPFFILSYWPAALDSRVALPVLMGLGVGIALLYKSFALAVPVGLALSWWHLHSRGYDRGAFLAKDALKIVLTMVVSLALFASWFLLDPDPHAIWKDFILRENLSKFDAGGGYISKLLWGSSSIWSLALAYPLNAGFLAFPVAMLVVSACRRRRELGDAEQLLWIWVITLFLVFSVPSQRSGRYLLPAMPALAVLLALNCHRVSRKAFVGSLLATTGVLGTIVFLSVAFQGAVPAVHFPPAHWLLLTSVGLVIVVGLGVSNLTPASVPVASLLILLSLAFLLRPLDGPLGLYDASVRRYVDGKDVWVPYDFVAKYEGHRFLLPGARIHGYRDDQETTPAELVARYPLVVLRLPLGDGPCQGCAILGRRLDLRGRQSSRELREILFEGDAQRLFVNEVLVEAQGRHH